IGHPVTALVQPCRDNAVRAQDQRYGVRMIYYGVLTIGTLAFGVLSLIIWLRTRQLAFVVGLAALYYWSLYGAWLIVGRELGNRANYRFEYLYYRLFPVYLDQYYLWTLVLYLTFILTIQITVLWLTERRRSDAGSSRPIVVSHPKIVSIAGLLTTGAYVIVSPVLRVALSTGVPAYGSIFDAQGAVPLFNVYQVLHQCALASAAMGGAVLLSGHRARYIQGSSGRGAAGIGYIAVLSAVLALNLMLGNRSMLLFAAIGGGLFYLANTRRPNPFVLVSGAFLAATAIVGVGTVRGPFGQEGLLPRPSPFGKARYLVAEAFSQDVEAFAAPLSLYGTLRKHVPLTYGSSLVWLAGSVLPRAVRPEFVPIVYFHYAASVGTAGGQGFTVHHAT